MEHLPNEENLEQHAAQEEREHIQRLLGNIGLYDASFDTYPTAEHPEDERWIIRSNN